MNLKPMKWLHNLLKGASLTGALFVFQACYGIRQDSPFDERGMAPMTFRVCSHLTGEPLRDIRVMVLEDGVRLTLGQTEGDGQCRVQIPYYRNAYGPFLTFEDPQGCYVPKDTVLVDLRDREIVIKMDVQ